MPLMTIFTPTYNRAYILPQLYKSLQSQTLKDFEWLIVDDGSTDNTEQMVNEWVHTENTFLITYIKQENGGKQRAVNVGVEYAVTPLFWIVDSDDWLPDNAMETAVKWFDTIYGLEGFAGIGGLRGCSEGILGTTFDGEYIDCTSLDRGKHNINGDKSEIFFTEILKKFPFPVADGEKFVPEALVWNRIAAAGYKLRWFNEIIYITEYLPDGYTKNVDKNLITNWQGYSLYTKEVLQSAMPLKDKILIGGAYCLRSLKRLCKKY